jgi:hypothetical protein
MRRELFVTGQQTGVALCATLTELKTKTAILAEDGNKKGARLGVLPFLLREVPDQSN